MKTDTKNITFEGNVTPGKCRTDPGPLRVTGVSSGQWTRLDMQPGPSGLQDMWLKDGLAPASWGETGAAGWPCGLAPVCDPWTGPSGTTAHARGIALTPSGK